MDTEKLTSNLVKWIKGQVERAGREGVVTGLSGGIDSAVVAVLCKRALPDSTLCLHIPCYSQDEDLEHARMVAYKFSIPFGVIILDNLYDDFLRVLASTEAAPSFNKLAISNLKVRLRMITLYYHANRLNYLVAGGSNRSELTVGYFTKWGDAGVDMMPLGNLVKQEVIELAKYLGVPQPIIEKPPSAGLWAGQTDEAEMGITYKNLDRYILTQEADDKIKDRIEVLHKRTEHKRQMPLKPPRWEL
jgi:NAD+ synthase